MNLSKCRRIVFNLATGGLLTLVMIILATQPIRAAGPWYVAPGGDDGNDCLSPGIACATINGASSKASPGDTIYVATGTYTGTGTQVVLLDKDVTLSGGWDSTFTSQSEVSTIDGEGSHGGITVNGGVTAIVERFIVQNGSRYTTSGWISGIANSGTLTLNNCTVRGNSAGQYSGGGIGNSGTLALNNSTVSGNTAGWWGGGIYSESGSVTVSNSTVSDNSAMAGGGIFSRNGSVTVSNSTFSGNTTSAGGGGIYSRSASVTVSNSTVSGNSASAGGGICNDPGSTVELTNTIVAAQLSGGDCGGDLATSLGHNLDSDSTCNLNATGDIPGANPFLGPLQDNGGPTETHALLSGSPAIDADDDSACLATDQRGVIRPLDGDGEGIAVCDIGAYEFELPTIMVLIDIKPGSDPNSINCNNETQVIAVAILATEDFDATTVDHTTVAFEGASEMHVNKKSGEPRRHEEDVDYDGDLDLVFHLPLDDTDLACDSTEGTLTGETFDGQAIQGTDSVRMVDRDDS